MNYFGVIFMKKKKEISWSPSKELKKTLSFYTVLKWVVEDLDRN